MKTFKITNITHLLDKNSLNYNKNLIIEYIDGIYEKKTEIKPKEDLFLKTNFLTISIRRLRIKGLISVIEVNDYDINLYEKKKSNKKILQKTEKENKKDKNKTTNNIVESKDNKTISETKTKNKK
ncbi:MAG TPA: hypothetical protein PLN85_00125 [archaeon]|nr:hypothetical protein [archaeon]